MSSHGLKIISATGKVKVLTPDDATVIAAGSLTMPNSLNPDYTYGEDIALGNTYDEEELSVLVVPRRPIFSVNYNRYVDGGTLYYNTFYLNNGSAYYTRNSLNGVMTVYTAGNKTVDEKDTWNPVLSVFPIAFWDKMGQTSFSSVRLFAATAYLFREPNDDTNFSLSGTASGSGGVSGGGGPGGPDNINDDYVLSFYGQGCGVVLGASCAWGYSAEVDLGSAKTLTKVEIIHRPYSIVNIGNYANGQFTVSLYYGSAWHSIFSGSWSGDYEPCPVNEGIATWLTGNWVGVTKIKIEASGSAQAWDTYESFALSEHITREFRAWGPNSSNDDENKIVYSIGNAGIDKVDYMICRKRFIQ